jgi:8-oxo-dGTP diphosphatase
MIRVVAAILKRRGRLLICQRRAGQAFPLRWEFPGGKVRPSETPRAALARELREELGVEARIGPVAYRTGHRYAEFDDAIQLVFYLAANPFPAPRNLIFARMAWARPGDLARYDFLPADRLLVTRLMRGEIADFPEQDRLRAKHARAVLPTVLRRGWIARHRPSEPAR